MDLLFNIDIHSSVAVYIQVENTVQFAIASGRLKAGDRLPSIRELSERLNTNPNTIAKAYRDLEVMGLLYTRRGMGVFVNKGIEAQCLERCYARTIDRLHEVVSEAKAAGMTAEDVMEIAQMSLAYSDSPYGETPAELLKLAKKKG